MEGHSRSGWLVLAKLGNKEFPLFTFEVETAAEAMAAIRLMGFCFGNEDDWKLRAERVALLSTEEKRAAAV
jgi:hypothetical protein